MVPVVFVAPLVRRNWRPDINRLPLPQQLRPPVVYLFLYVRRLRWPLLPILPLPSLLQLRFMLSLVRLLKVATNCMMSRMGLVAFVQFIMPIMWLPLANLRNVAPKIRSVWMQFVQLRLLPQFCFMILTS